MNNIAKLRQWHLRLAIITGFFIVFQGVTGTIAQQRFQLMAWSEPDFYSVESNTGQMLTPEKVLDKVRSANPGFRPTHVMYPAASSPNVAVIVMGGRKPVGMDMSRNIMVDQYSGKIIAERSSQSGWVGKVTGLHKWTSYGVPGRIVLTIFGLLIIAMLLLSLRLAWLTRGYANRFVGLKKWHRRLGVFVGSILLVVSATGIALNLYTWSEKTRGSSVVSNNMRTAMKNGTPDEIVVGLAEAYKDAIGKVGHQRLAAFSEAGPHAAKHWFAFTDDRLKRTDVLIDPLNGELSVYPAGVLEGGAGLRNWLFPIHSGYILGWVGGLMMTIIGVSIVFWPVSGIVIWRRRK